VYCVLRRRGHPGRLARAPGRQPPQDGPRSTPGRRAGRLDREHILRPAIASFKGFGAYSAVPR